jgi:hypothetical protein
MSGIVGSKLNVRGSGIVAKLGTDGQGLTSSGVGVTAAFEDLAAGISWQTIVTGSTMTAVAGNGYWVDTSSNACTITLPASASAGDTIIFTDYARNWGTNGITIDPNGLNYQSRDDTFTIEYGTDGMTLSVVYMDSTQGWVPTSDEAVADVPIPPPQNPYGLFGFGYDGSSNVSLTNLVNSSGVVASDTTGVGTARKTLAGCEYGNDKGIFGFGHDGSASSALTNLVSNAGVVATDTAGVGTAIHHRAAATYGGDKGIFAYGAVVGSNVSTSNLVSNTGVVSSDVSGVGTARSEMPAACEFGTDKDRCIFGFGHDGSVTGVTNLVSNTGVVASDVSAVGTARYHVAACGFGDDEGIFAFGGTPGLTAISNLVSNVGVVASDTTGVGTARNTPAATQYGTDKGIFGFGTDASDYTAVTNLVSNAGVVATDVTGVGTARNQIAACSYG